MLETIAASRPAMAFSRLDLPTLGGPTMAISRPSRRRMPAAPFANSASTSVRTPLTAAAAFPSISGGNSSSAKSMPASNSANARCSAARQPAKRICAAPPAPLNACRRCAAVSARTRSESASTETRSRRPLSNARRVNSPASASRQWLDELASPPVTKSRTALTTAGPPCRCSSAISSPVNDPGLGSQTTSPRSSSSPVFGSRKDRSTIVRAAGRDRPVIARTIAPDAGPESRTTATPAGSAPLANATIVSGTGSDKFSKRLSDTLSFLSPRQA